MVDQSIFFGVVGVAALLVIFLIWKGRQRNVRRPTTLDPEKKIPMKLIEKHNVSHDTRRFRFALPSNQHVLGLPVGKHMYLSAHINNELITRPYTPVTSDDEVGFFDLVIKVYKQNVHPKYPEGGKMSQYLDSLQIGDTISCRGPGGKVVYAGRGTFLVKEPGKPEETRLAKQVGLIAGGTGITPMLQIIRAILKDEEDDTQVSLLFANQTEDDILLRLELEQEAQKHRKFKLWYTLDQPPKNWPYSEGFVSDSMIADHLPPPGPDTQILACGPPPMIKFAVRPNLEKLNYSSSMYVMF